MNIYETCPVLESEKFIIRLFQDDDCDDLLKVYSDKNALPFFNSDNCDGDNFYYSTKERMTDAIGFWHMAYENGWFVRMSIVDKAVEAVIGTVELCVRVSEDAFDNMGILRVDRVKAIQKVGFTKSEHMLIGKTGYAYDGYWTIV